MCRFIDPAPEKWRTGKLEVQETWERVGINITHYASRPYLTLVDHGPSRFSVWRHLRLQTAANVVQHLECIFYERGAPGEIILNNDTAFRSKCFRSFAEQWGIRLRYRCAYVPSSNGIVERCHRTVKTIGARKECSIPEAVYRYNTTPRDESPSSSPANMMDRYTVRVKDVDPPAPPADDELHCNRYEVGDTVWVRPQDVRCDSKYNIGRVTGILSEQAVEVNGIPRHVRNLRTRQKCDQGMQPPGASEEENDALFIRIPPHADQRSEDVALPAPEERELPRRSQRGRRPVLRFCCEE